MPYGESKQGQSASTSAFAAVPIQPKHAEMARAILWWKLRYPHTKVLLSKKDISDAFKWVPVRLEDTRLFAADMPGHAFGLATPVTVIYNTLTFGWCGAPGEFMLYAWLAKLARASYAPTSPQWNDQVTFKSLVLMDDTVLVEPAIGVRPWLSLAASEECIKATLGPRTINPEKDAIEGALEETKLIWGLVYDTGRGTRSLPPAKLSRCGGSQLGLGTQSQMWLAHHGSSVPHIETKGILRGRRDICRIPKPTHDDGERGWRPRSP